jgi:hypothetical protein
MTELHKIGVKLFCATDSLVDPEVLIPIFHRWIQQKRTTDLLIDVADYSHVPMGPGVVLIADEGHYSFDESGGRKGFSLFNKRPIGGDLGARLATVARRCVVAAVALQSEPELAGRLSFRGDELLVCFNDRLNAPNSEEVFARLKPDILKLLDVAFGRNQWTLSRSEDPRERLSVSARATVAVNVATLASRLAPV